MSRQATMYKQRSNLVQGTEFSVSLVANLLTAIQVRDQYLSGKVNPLDATGLVVGTAGLTAEGFSLIGFAPQTMSGVSAVTGRVSIYLAAIQSWIGKYQTIFKEDWEYNMSTGSFETDFQIQMEQSKGIYNDADHFR